jgi:hypothetical protein
MNIYMLYQTDEFKSVDSYRLSTVTESFYKLIDSIRKELILNEVPTANCARKQLLDDFTTFNGLYGKEAVDALNEIIPDSHRDPAELVDTINKGLKYAHITAVKDGENLLP